MVFLIVLTPLTHWVFYITGDNIFYRGPLYLLIMLVANSYVISFAFATLYRARQERLRDLKRPCIHLVFYTLIPLFGSSLQLVNDSLNFAVPAILISILLIYLKNITQDITLDPLTKLNNRSQLDRYISSKQDSHPDTLCLAMIDIDHFKLINDKLGHIEGDRAIRTVATAMKLSASSRHLFLSRYGGDEFVIAMVTADLAELQDYIAHVEAYLKEDSLHLSISVGYAKYEAALHPTIEAFIQDADTHMYHTKHSKKHS